MTRRRRWTIAVIILVLVTAPLVLLTSETALRVVAGTLTQRIAALEIENPRGRLLTGVSADRVAWQQPDGVAVTVTGFRSAWRALPALVGRLYFTRVEASSVEVVLAPVRDEPTDAVRSEFTLPARIEIPIVVRIDTLEVGSVTITRDARTLFAVESVDGTDLYADPDTYRVGRLAAIGDPASFELSGTVQPAGAWPADIDARWRVQLPDRPRFDGTLSVRGALDRTLQVEVEAHSADAGTARFSGELRSLLRAPTVDGRLVATDLHTARWADAAPEAVVSADLLLDGWVQDLAIRGTASVATPEWPQARVDADLHWGRQLLAVRSARVRSDELDTTVGATGHVDWSGEALAGNARADWRALRWPLGESDAPLRSDAGQLEMEFGSNTARAVVRSHLGAHEEGQIQARADLLWLDGESVPRIDGTVNWEHLIFPGIASDHGRASVQGTLDDWAGAVVAAFAPAGLPMMTLAADATGDSEGLHATDIHADLLDGTAQGELRLSWADGWSGDTNLVLAEIDPVHILPEFAGRVGGQFQAQLSSVDGTIAWTARLRDGVGVAAERRFSARAEVSGTATGLRDIDAAVALGDAEALISGRWAPEIELAWAVRAPDLSVLLPGAAGRFVGEGFVRGDPSAPALEFDIRGEAIAYGGVSVTQLSGDGDLDLAGVRDGRAVLRMNTLDFGERTVDELEVVVSGPRTALTIAVNAQADLTNFQARVSGAWTDEHFDGRMDLARLAHNDDLPWQLNAPAALLLGREVMRLARACWQQQETPNELCVEGSWAAGAETRARAALNNLPVAELSAWLPIGFQYTGRVGGEASLRWPAGGNPEAEGRLSITDGSWRQNVGDESVALLQWSNAAVEARLDDGDLDATIGFALVDGGNLDASITLAVFDTAAGPTENRPLRARFVGEFSEFDLIPALVPDIGSITGIVRADLTVTGTLDDPLFAGTLAIDDGTTTIPRLGIRLTDMGFAIDGNRNMVGVRGRARSGPGTLEIDGDLGLRDGRLTGELRIVGDNFQAANIPEARVNISPQLTVGLAGHAVNVDGEVRIPTARLAPRDIANTVTVSADEVLIDEDASDDDEDPWRITARVRIVMGDVEFTGFGLTGEITGSLTAIDVPGQLTRATGELQIVEGRYQAWGQALEIERGRLIFTGGPISEPGVDVLAVRHPQDVTVGVNVRGTLRDPELRLHSEPAMTQSEQLSWLVLGAPLDRATGSEQALLDRTRNTAGLAGGDFVARQLGRRLGLSDVGIDRGDSPEEAALVIGHYLSPRLYIGYGIGIFDPANSLRLRFHIDRHWSIEAETGDRATSTDLRFTIER